MNKSWWFVLLAMILAVVSLWLNIRTVSLNEVNVVLRGELDYIKKQNLDLYYKLLDESRYAEIEARAISRLGMVKPGDVEYIEIRSDREGE